MPIAAAKAAFTDFLTQCQSTGYWHHKTHGLITALSGGPDSLALALVADQVAKAQNIRHKALIIDHGLRRESGDEAQQIYTQLTQRDIQAEIQTITQTPPKTGIQNWARTHRLALLAKAGRDQRSCVVFGHHRGDQAETVALRLAHHSGLRGLAGIAPLRFFQGALFARPFLGLSKSELVAVCTHFNAPFIQDPSNKNRKFERVRWRNLLEDDGVMTQNLLRLSDLSAQVTRKLDIAVYAWMKRHVKAFFALSLSCDKGAFLSLPPVQQIAVLTAMLARCGSYEFLPSQAALHVASRAIENAQTTTLAGCVITPYNDHLVIEAEYGRTAPTPMPLQADQIGFFDQRWIAYSQLAGHVHRLGALKLSKDEKNTILDALYPIKLKHRQEVMIPVLQTLDGRILPPHFMRDRHLYYASAGSDIRRLCDADRHPYLIWPAPNDGPIPVPDMAPSL